LIRIWANLVGFGQIIVAKLGQKLLDLRKFDKIWAKSKSCILKNIWSPTTVLQIV